jgi:hypothetical protein
MCGFLMCKRADELHHLSLRAWLLAAGNEANSELCMQACNNIVVAQKQLQGHHGPLPTVTLVIFSHFN